MAQQAHTNEGTSNEQGLSARLDEIAWAAFLVMTGALWLVPTGWAPEGTWLLGLGLILLGLNGARWQYRLRPSGFGIAAGIAALVAGAGRVLGGAGLFVPILLVTAGIALALGAISKARHAGDASGAPSEPCR